jgi:hypothetical protein
MSDGLLLPVGYPNTKLAGTEVGGVGVDPINGTVVAPNSVSFPSKNAQGNAARDAIAAGHSSHGLGLAR